MSRPLVAGVIVAGGSGERFGRAGGKQLALIAGEPVLTWTVRALAAVRGVDRLVIVCHPERVAEYRDEAVVRAAIDLPWVVVPGGDTRQESVAAGLDALGDDIEVVAVHDGARPLVLPDVISEAIAVVATGRADGAVIGHPSVDTLKIVSDGVIVETPPRERYWAVQTPQVFRLDTLRRAQAAAAREGFLGTDDASLVERAGGRVIVVEGPRDNVKITMPEDVAYAEAVLAERKAQR